RDADILDARNDPAAAAGAPVDTVVDKNLQEGDYVPSTDFQQFEEDQPGDVHGHVSLKIYIKDKQGKYQQLVVPDGIGRFSSTGLSDIHTHSTDGIVHLEGPPGATWTLKDIFRNWGISL